MFSKRKLGMILASGALVATTALAGVAILPHSTLAAPQNVAVAQTGAGGAPGAPGVPGKGGPQDDTFLANALGITTDALTQARETARIAAIDQALQAGTITQAQADALKQNDRSAGRYEFLLRDSSIDQQALLAKALGITVEKLQQANQAAADARLAQAVADGKITQEQVDLMKAEQALRTYFQEKDIYGNAVKSAVVDGVITQAQADAILSRQQQGGMPPFGGFGGPGGRGGFRGFGAPNGPAGQAPQNAPVTQ